MASEVFHNVGWTEFILDFTSFPLGTATTFTETVDGFAVTYVANDPFAFKTVDSEDIPVSPSTFPWLLGEAGSSSLGIIFSHAVFGVAIEFATLGPGPIQMDLMSGGLGGSVVATLSQSGSIPGGLIYPEGFLSLLPTCICPNYFDAVRLTDSSDPSFAIRRIFVAKTPEPATLAMFGVGLALLALLRLPRCTGQKKPFVDGQKGHFRGIPHRGTAPRGRSW
jgi:hypothetical protein